MSLFTKFESQAIRLLASPRLPNHVIDLVMREATLVSYESTGSGYFLTVAHAQLPEERIVCHDPIVMGHSDGIDCGFVLFLEKREMMIECHTWGAVEVPEDFRSRDVVVDVRHDVAR